MLLDIDKRGEIISRTSVQHITKDDIAQPDIQAQLAEYQDSIDSKLKTDSSSYPISDHEFNQFVNEDIPSPYENEAMDDTLEVDDIVKDNITSGEDTYDGLI